MKTITAIVKRPGEPAFKAEIEDTLETMQSIVGGWIQYLPGDPMGLPAGVCNYSHEEAKIIGLEPNFWIFDRQDQIWGPCFFVGGDESTGENRSLTEDECAAVLGWLDEPGRVL